MAPTYFLDTNIFLRFIHKSNLTSFKECKLLLESIKQGNLSAVSSSHVLAEISWTLKSYSRYPRVENIKYLKSICRLSNLSIIDDVQIDQALIYFERFNIKFIDCLIASSKHLQSGKWQLVSYDTDFDKIKSLKRFEPKQVLSSI